MTTIIRVQTPRARYPSNGPIKVEPGGGFTVRRGRPLGRDHWPRNVTQHRINLFKVLTIRPDDYLTTGEILTLWNAAGFPPISQGGLVAMMAHLRAINWIQARSAKQGTRRLAYRLAPRPLHTVKYYVASGSGDE